MTLFAYGAAAADGPKQVLVLHSFGRDFAPYDATVAAFRTELAQRAPAPIAFVEVNLDLGRSASPREQQAVVDYLTARFAQAPPDLVVTIGPPAARFYLRHRAELFGATPLVAGAMELRMAPPDGLLPQDRVVAVRLDLPKLFDNIMQLLPATERIVLVTGASEIERFWLGEVQRELAPLAGRVEFESLGSLSLAQMQQRVAQLPPHSALLYMVLIVDAAGVPHERQDAVAALHAAANAPLFGIFESELGYGVVGGPYASQRASGAQMAAAALRALVSPTAGIASGTQIDVVPFSPPVYDWRELRRWNIDLARLPADATIRFRPPSLWEAHRTEMIATVAALLVQSALIVALLAQRARRRRAEGETQRLAGRLVTAHEDERRRLARELHDDVSQRLAGLALEAARGEAGASAATASIRSGLAELSEDVHALSYRLHPSVLEDLGLIEALRIECDRVAQHGGPQVGFDCADVPRNLAPDLALCLFRVAQQALHNVERHAQAQTVAVRLARQDGGLMLTVRDDGIGFDAAARPEKRTSLGLASMRERVRLLGGRLAITSTRGTGTTLSAWVPLPENA